MSKEKLNPTETKIIKDESLKVKKIVKKRTARKRGSTLLRAVLLILVLVLAFGLIGRGNKISQWWPYITGKSSNPLSTPSNIGINSRPSELQVPVGAQAEEDAVVQVADQASKAVVSIIITKDVPKIQNNFFDPFGGSGQDPSSLFDQFFGGQSQLPQMPPQQQQQPGNGGTVKQEIGGGSGFVVSEDGLIVTNKHVVADPSADYTVLTNDGREYDAKVLGRDRTNDVAVIKIDPSKPTKGNGVDKMDTLPLGNSGQIKVGQTVVAIGNALGEFTNTVSKGIVSGLRRNITAGGLGGSEQLDQLIQTDAAINEGNSGGPLLNLKGEVIGINVAIAQGAQNIGFALPIDTVKNTIQSVEKNGKISQPYLGVRYQLLNKAIQQNSNLPFDYGAMVLRGQDPTQLAVIPGSPADKAGIQENDIILEANGAKIDDKNPLAKIIGGMKVGDSIDLKVWHKGNTNNVKVALSEAPNNTQ
jgi:serine protease Do